MVAAKLANMKLGDNQYKSGSANWPTPPISQSEAAELLNVSERSVASAKQVVQHGIPDLAQVIEVGDISVSLANQISKFEPQEQESVIGSHDHKAILKAAKEI